MILHALFFFFFAMQDERDAVMQPISGNPIQCNETKALQTLIHKKH